MATGADGDLAEGPAPSNRAERDSPPVTPSDKPNSKVEMFTLLSPEELTQVRQDLTSPVRARTPPRAGTPPRSGARADAAGTGTRATPAGRGATPWKACCTRPTDSGARRESAQPVRLARSPALARKGSLQGGEKMPAGLHRMTQSCDLESTRHERDRQFGRKTAHAPPGQPNLLRDASSVLQEMAEAMREIYTMEETEGTRRTR
eukprot:COSAG02_NODE_2932_length_7712_cov_2.172468_4_plen_205_part_00